MGVWWRPVGRAQIHIGMNSLALDPARETDRIAHFLRRQLARTPRRQGFVVGLSGGIDSAVTAALACRAMGPGKVLGVLLPEKESQPESQELAEELASSLGIETLVEDLTPTLELLGIYRRREDIVRRLVSRFEEGWRYCLKLPGDLRRHRELNVYRLEVRGPASEVESLRLPPDLYRRIQAATNVKQRLRMVRLFEYAEARSYLVAGTTNRTEMAQGFFVRFGDGGVDLEPLAHLFKTQVYELGRYLQVPEGTLSRPPSPDAYSAAVSTPSSSFGCPTRFWTRCWRAGRRGSRRRWSPRRPA